ncbi:YoaK family protein [Enterobacter cancerogenus]|uniref:YoaK family protein n=1 Tax=Enterobacter cancerogenus TaxID=69218 RepID=UPI00053690BC|nr:YoaK family protein [Enterobacter cancerogenus]KGT92756.1 transmembrane protein [Enterobacter cancerogenus]
MLITSENTRTFNTDTRLACTLAAVAGALNTAAFETVGFFSANMTGNVSSLSDHLAKANLHVGLFFLLIVLLFIAGSSVSTLIINSGRRRQIRGIYAINILLEGVALLALGVIESWFSFSESGVLLVLSLSFLMGLQNAVVTRISNARVRTTHVSGTATDIGIEVAMLFDVLRRKESPKDAPLYIERLKLHFFTVMAFLFGGVLGILLLNALSYKLLILIGVMLSALALSALQRAGHALHS